MSPGAPSGGREDAERGGVLALTLGALGVAGLLVVVVAVASAVYLDRRELLALADATAAHAATSIDPAAYAEGLVVLTDAGVRAGAEEFLASVPIDAVDVDRLALAEPTGAPDEVTAQVTLVGRSRPAFLPWLLAPWSDGIVLRVTSTAAGT